MIEIFEKLYFADQPVLLRAEKLLNERERYAEGARDHYPAIGMDRQANVLGAFAPLEVIRDLLIHKLIFS